MTTYVLTQKDQTAVTKLAELIRDDPEAKTVLEVQVDGASVYKREFEKLMADEHSVLNNVSYTIRKKAGWIDGTRTPSTPSASPATSTGEGKAHSRVQAQVNAATKLAVTFNMEQGIANLALGDQGKGIVYVPVAAVLDVNEEGFFVPRAVLATWTRRLSEVATNVGKALLTATELGIDGKEIAEGWSFEGYVSHKLDKNEACADILQQSIAKLDKPFFKAHSMALMDGEVELVKVGDSSKIAWIAEFLPVPEEPAKEEPATPSETPADEKSVMAQAGDPAGTGENPQVTDAIADEARRSASVDEVPAAGEAAPATDNPEPAQEPELVEVEAAPAPAPESAPAPSRKGKIR